MSGWFLGGVGLVLVHLLGRDRAVSEQMQGRSGMLHPCTKSGNELDQERERLQSSRVE